MWRTWRGPATDHVLFLLCGILAVVGAWLPWATVSASFLDTVREAGIDGDGRITLALRFVVGLLGLWTLLPPTGGRRGAPIVGLILSTAITVIALVNVTDIRSVTGPLTPEARSLLDTSVGVGLWCTLVAGLAGVAGGNLALLPAGRGDHGAEDRTVR